MESIVNAAIEEICARGANGLSLSQLWPTLHQPLSAAGLPSPIDAAVKRALWSNLHAVPGLRFFSSRSDAEFDNSDPKVQSVDECERLDLKIVANERLKDCFFGLYNHDTSTSSISGPQRQVLERLAMARANGITQNQLSKELGMRGNNFFYVVKSLESRGLVVRQPLILRTEDTSSDATKRCSSLVSTNLIRLHRYATPLRTQQRLEITKQNKNFEENTTGAVDELGQEHVLVNDFLPAMKAVCDKLEQADGKVLVVADIKVDLGYRKSTGHRRWRNLCNRLQQAGLVEVFEAKEDDNDEDKDTAKTKNKRKRKTPLSCLRLLKSFSPNLFEPKTLESVHDEIDSEQLTSVQRGQSEQIVELPIEHQIIDMVDAHGSKGLVIFELCRRLGISNKKNHNRIIAMSSRFGLHQLPESHKKGTAYRCWTPRNFQHQSLKSSSKRPEDTCSEHENISPLEHPTFLEPETVPSVDCSVPQGAEQGFTSCSQEVIGCDHSDTASDYSLVEMVGCSGTLVETAACSSPMPVKIQSRQRYPSLTSSQREQRILERLKKEKFILRCELRRWLENLEDKHTRIDVKTVIRCLENLQNEGHCSIHNVYVPSCANYATPRTTYVILHSSVSRSVGDLLEEIKEKLRAYDLLVRQSSCTKTEQSVPTLTSIQRLKQTPNAESLDVQLEPHVGSVLPKMVRARLLHNFLWGYVNDSSDANHCSSEREKLSVFKNPHSTCKLFALEEAVKAIPMELFIQVVGSIHKQEDIRDRHKTGAVLSDLSPDECKQLMNTKAMGRLSQVIDILRRLKLIRMIANEHVVDGNKVQHAALAHALELKPYFEEPQFINPVSKGSGSPDLRPHSRHDFILMTKEALDEYWETLEYCYAAANPTASLHAFPGSIVRELCFSRSWSRCKLMAANHNPIKHILINDQYAKLTFKQCKEIASDRNWSLAHVLCEYYGKQLPSLDRNQGVLRAHCQDSSSAKARNPLSLKKRKVDSGLMVPSKRVEVEATIDCEEDHHTESLEENRVNEQLVGVSRSTSCKAKPALKQTHSQKFLWDDEADKKLLIQYARKRATHGATGLRSWASITDLPASPSCCRRRIAVLKKDDELRKSLMCFCNLLSQPNADTVVESNQEPDYQKDQWDNFNDDKIKVAFDKVLSHLRRMKDIAKGTASITEDTHGEFSATNSEFQPNCTREEMSSCQMAIDHRLPERVAKQWEEGLNVVREAHTSVSVANAIELFKLLFLSTSTSTEDPNLSAETLRCYSEHDLSSAFDYLRQKRIMVKSRGHHPYVLSQHFLQGLSLSQFPTNTGKRADKLAGWIREKEKDLMDGVVSLFADLQCGDIFHLVALVSRGEMTISPLLPNEGVGKANDWRNRKRGWADTEIDSVNKKQKVLLLHALEPCDRQEKGFPGIQVLLSRPTIPRPDVVEFFRNDDIHSLLPTETNQFYTMLGQQIHNDTFIIDCMKEAPDFGSIATEAVYSGESKWEVISNFTKKVLGLSDEEQQNWIPPCLFQSITMAIQDAGDQGLGMSEVSKLVCMPGKSKAEDIVDVLQAFGMAYKVNGYDSFRVVDRLYRSKYFLNSKASCSKDTLAKDQEYDDYETRRPGEVKNVEEVHKVTILNLSEKGNKLSNAIDHSDEMGQCSQSKQMPGDGSYDNEHIDASSSNLQPILPWMNGDGTVNTIVYQGLRRRILGIVMQRPGILEDDVISQMDVINPQSCKKLLELMRLDNHIYVRKMHQATSFGPPSLLRSVCGSEVGNPKFVFREHLFCNPMSTCLL